MKLAASIITLLTLVAAASLATDAEPAAASQPAASQPAASQPATSQPATSQPATSQPATSQPATSQPALPAGHPPLPANHPQLDSSAPTSQPSGPRTLVVHALQGTKEGKSVAGDPVTVQLFSRHRQFKTIQTKLDEHGVAYINDLPVAMGFQPLAVVKHAGVGYSAVGKLMTDALRDQTLSVKVYETTDARPALQIPMWHLMAKPTPDGLEISEMIAVQNPTDRTWVGKRPDEKTAPTTLTLPLPPGAQHVRLGQGFHKSYTKLQEDRVLLSVPLQPGTGQFRYAYVIPAKEGTATLQLKASMPVKHAMIFLPDDDTVVTVEGLEAGGVMEMGKSKVRMYKAENVPADHQASVTVSNLPAPPPPVEALQGAAPSTSPKTIAAIGGGAILLTGLTVLLVKSPRRRDSADGDAT